MTNLRDMNARMEQWINEKPQGGGGNQLYLNENDVVLFWFCSNGDDGNKLIEMYRSHAFEGRTKKGFPMDILRYCPVQNGVSDMACPHCAAGNTKFKERMSMWFYVTNILHAQLPQDKQLPQVEYSGRYYFNEEVNDFRIWETSGWRESPRADIITLAGDYKGLHNFTARMQCTGSQTTKRFKLYAIPNSPFLDPAIYERAKQECYSIHDHLLLEINQAVSVNPQAQQTPAGYVPQGIDFSKMSLPQQPATVPFTPPGQSIPSLQLPGLSPAPSQPGSPVPAPLPIAAFTAPDKGGTPRITSETEAEIVAAAEVGAPAETPPFETEPTPETPAEPTAARRPLKAMF